MKKLQTFDASGVGQRVGADQVVVFTFKDEMVGALRHPTEERVRKRCKNTKDMFA